MRNNLSYYQRRNDAFRHAKFKYLRNKYGWEGEGRFWALIDMISEAENCTLNLKDNKIKISVLSDLGFSKKQDFDDFISFLLSEDLELLTEVNGGITAKKIQETLKEVTIVREKSKTRKTKSRVVEKSVVTPNFTNVTRDNPLCHTEIPESSASKTTKESKVKENKENNNKEKEIPPLVDSFFDINYFPDKLIKDDSFIEPHIRSGLTDQKIYDWLLAFNRFLSYKGDNMRQEKEYRMHFANWLKFHSGKDPTKYEPVTDTRTYSFYQNNNPRYEPQEQRKQL